MTRRFMFWMLFCLAAAVWAWAGCATTRDGDLRAAQEYYNDISERKGRVFSANPDYRCEDVCGQSESICALSDKICRLGENYPGDADFLSRCQAGQNDCGLARAKCNACR